MRDIDRVPGVSAAGARQNDPDAAGIVVLCTANVCRSPMGAALLARRLSQLAVAARCGTLPVWLLAVYLTFRTRPRPRGTPVRSA